MPAITLFAGERAQINFGGSSEKLKYYMYFESAGYKPLCSHSTLQYNIPLWYSYHGGFKNLRELEQRRNSKFVTQQTSSGFSVHAREWDYAMQSEQEVLRLNMGFTVSSSSDVPLTPTLVPRPGILSPTPSPENASFTLSEGLTMRPDNKPISFSVVFPAGQVPSAVFLGWTTPSFRYVPSQFASKDEEEEESKNVEAEGKIRTVHSRASYGQCLEVRNLSAQGSVETVNSLKTAFMVRLCDLLPMQTAQLVFPVK